MTEGDQSYSFLVWFALVLDQVFFVEHAACTMRWYSETKYLLSFFLQLEWSERVKFSHERKWKRLEYHEAEYSASDFHWGTVSSEFCDKQLSFL